MNLAEPVAPAPEHVAYASPARAQQHSAPAEPVSAADVVAYLLTRLGPMQQLRLQKLLYYCQAWRLAYGKPPLFWDEIEAWAAGPVVPTVWRAHAYEYTIESEPNGNPQALSAEQRSSVESVLERYEGYTGNELSQLTHREEPWLVARGGLPDGARCNRTIPHGSMAHFYGKFLPQPAHAAVMATAG